VEGAEPASIPPVDSKSDLARRVIADPTSTPLPVSPFPAALPLSSARPQEAAIEPEPREAERDHPLVLRLPVGTRLADAERKLILLRLEAGGGNKQGAAGVLGISRRGLYSKLQAYGEHVGAQEPQEPAEPGGEADSEPAAPGEEIQIETNA